MIPSTGEVWEAFHRRLYTFIRKRVNDPQDAEDILQEVFLRVHTRLDSLRDEERLSPWLYQVARHAVIDYYRTRRPNTALPEHFPVESEFSESNPAVEIASGLEFMITNLPEKYRSALMLSEIQGIKHKDIAAQLGLSLSGVKSRVQRGGELLRQDLWSCCHFEFDRSGRLMHYEPRLTCCQVCDRMV